MIELYILMFGEIGKTGMNFVHSPSHTDADSLKLRGLCIILLLLPSHCLPRWSGSVGRDFTDEITDSPSISYEFPAQIQSWRVRMQLLPLLKIDRPSHPSYRNFLLWCRRGILQFVLVKPVLSCVALFLEMHDLYEDGVLRWDRGYLYIAIINNISITVRGFEGIQKEIEN